MANYIYNFMFVLVKNLPIDIIFNNESTIEYFNLNYPLNTNNPQLYYDYLIKKNNLTNIDIPFIDYFIQSYSSLYNNIFLNTILSFSDEFIANIFNILQDKSKLKLLYTFSKQEIKCQQYIISSTYIFSRKETIHYNIITKINFEKLIDILYEYYELFPENYNHFINYCSIIDEFIIKYDNNKYSLYTILFYIKQHIDTYNNYIILINKNNSINITNKFIKIQKLYKQFMQEKYNLCLFYFKN